jgi:hypothetical protein
MITEKPIREIAEEITVNVAQICGCNWESCTAVRTATRDAIEKALRDRDERAAKIAERAFEPAHTYASENSSAYRTYDAGQRHVIEKIASAIRGKS